MEREREERDKDKGQRKRKEKTVPRFKVSCFGVRGPARAARPEIWVWGLGFGGSGKSLAICKKSFHRTLQDPMPTPAWIELACSIAQAGQCLQKVLHCSAQ